MVSYYLLKKKVNSDVSYYLPKKKINSEGQLLPTKEEGKQ